MHLFHLLLTFSFYCSRIVLVQILLIRVLCSFYLWIILPFSCCLLVNNIIFWFVFWSYCWHFHLVIFNMLLLFVLFYCSCYCHVDHPFHLSYPFFVWFSLSIGCTLLMLFGSPFTFCWYPPTPCLCASVICSFAFSKFDDVYNDNVSTQISLLPNEDTKG
jgi:hypothetical protein